MTGEPLQASFTGPITASLPCSWTSAAQSASQIEFGSIYLVSAALSRMQSRRHICSLLYMLGGNLQRAESSQTCHTTGPASDAQTSVKHARQRTVDSKRSTYTLCIQAYCSTCLTFSSSTFGTKARYALGFVTTDGLCKMQRTKQARVVLTSNQSVSWWLLLTGGRHFRSASLLVALLSTIAYPRLSQLKFLRKALSANAALADRNAPVIELASC